MTEYLQEVKNIRNGHIEKENNESKENKESKEKVKSEITNDWKIIFEIFMLIRE